MRKVRNLIIAILSIVCVACMFTACAKPSISLDKATMDLGWGETGTITATLTDSEDTIKWSSSNEDVVTVDQNGLVTAVETGTATVTATAGEGKKQVSASCTVTVGEYQLAVTASVDTVVLDAVKVGDDGITSETVTASAIANGADVVSPVLTWASSNSAVATVNNGVITAVAAGEATITVTVSKDNRTATDTIEVTVRKNTVDAPYAALKEYNVSATSISQALESLGLAGYTGGVTVTSTGATVASAAIDGDNLVINATANATGNVDYVVEVADRILTLKVNYYTLTVTATEDYIELTNIKVGSEGVTTASIAYTANKAGGTATYTLSETGIVTVSASGEVTAVALGDVTITITYTFDGFTATDTIDVSVTKIEVQEAYNVGEIVLTDGVEIALTDIGVDSSYSGNIRLAIAGVAATTAIDSGKIVVSDELDIWGEKNVIIELDDRILTAKATFVTDVLTTKEDILAFTNYPHDYATYTGYYKLGANIDMQGEFLANGVRAKDNIEQGFQGLFDGQGYAIYNFKLKANGEHSGGLFGSIGGNGVVKNFALIQGVWTGEGGSNSFGVIAGALYGTIENVIVDFAVSGNATNANGLFYSTNTNIANPVVKNAIVRVNDLGATHTGGYGEAIATTFREHPQSTKENPIPNVGIAGITLENIYVIQSAKNNQNELGLFADKVTAFDIFDSSEWSFTGFDSNIWNTDGAMPVLKNMFVVTEKYSLKASEGVYNPLVNISIPVAAGQKVSYTTAKIDGVDYVIDNASEVADITIAADTVIELKLNAYDSINVVDDAGADTGVNIEYRDSIGAGHFLDYVGTHEGKESVYKYTNDGSDYWAKRLAFNKDGVNYLAGQTATDTMRAYKTLKLNVMFEEGTTAIVAVRGNTDASKVELNDYSAIVGQKQYIRVFDANGNEVTAACEAGKWYTVVVETQLDVATTSHHNVYFITTTGAGTIYISDAILSNNDFIDITINEDDIYLAAKAEDGETTAQLTTTTVGTATVAWSSSDNEVATVVDGLVTTAGKEGSAIITVTYTLNGLTVKDSITVYVKPLIATPYEVGDIDLSNNPAIDLTLIGLTADYNGVANVQLVGVGALDGVSIEEGKIKLPSGISVCGEQQFKIELDDKIVLVNAVIVTKIIDTKAEFVDFANNAHTRLAGSYYGGYYILGANIDLGNTLIKNQTGTAFDSGFNGIFDGRGYAVSNFEITSAASYQAGVFGAIAKAGVVENVGFLNVRLGGTSNGTGVVAGSVYGKLRNIIVDAVVTSQFNSFFGIAYHTRGDSIGLTENVLLENVIVMMKNDSVRISSGASTTFGASPFISWVRGEDKSYLTANNLYAILDNGIVLEEAFASATKSYTLYGENTYEFTNLPSDIWDTTGALPVLKNMKVYTETMSYKQDDGSYVQQYSQARYGYVGMPLGNTYYVHDNGNYDGLVENADELPKTLTAETTVVALKASKNAVINIATGVQMGIATHQCAPTIKNIGEFAGEQNVYKIHSSTIYGSNSEWYERIQTGSTDTLKTYSTLTFKIMLTSSKKVYLSKKTTVNTTANSIYFNNSAGKLESVVNDGDNDWVTVADAEGNPIAVGTVLDTNAWYTVTIDLANLGASMYFCAASGATYYVCDFAVA